MDILYRKTRTFSQEDLGYKINKHQSEISKIENQRVIEDEILEQIALALEVSADFLKTFDFEETAKNYYNNSTNTITDNPNSTNEINQALEQENIITNNYPIDQFKDFAENTLKLQKELLEEKNTLDKENALLKQELQFLKNKK